MNILTFDIEDWYNHDDYSRDFAWEKHEVRIYEGTDKILSALDEKGLKGTFFCVGWIAEHQYGHMCFMTHDKNTITQDDIDAVRDGVLWGMYF